MTRHRNRRHQKGGFFEGILETTGSWWDKTKSAASSLNPLASNTSSSTYTAPAPAPAVPPTPYAPAPTSSINTFGGKRRRHKRMTLKGGKRKLRRTHRNRH